MSPQDPSPVSAVFSKIEAQVGHRSPAFFLDFDGTLAPIVAQPEMAEVPAETLKVLRRLADKYPVCIVSGRPLEFLRTKVDSDTLFFAADHGHRIVGPPDSGVDFEVGPEDNDEVKAATLALGDTLRKVAGVLLEVKGVSVAVHYRRVAECDRGQVREAVNGILQKSPGLRLMEGKMVYELMPDIAWGKGQAVMWLLNHLQPMMTEVFPVCVGDDITDEDMFAVVKDRGASVVVGDPDRPTQADHRLDGPFDLPAFLRLFLGTSSEAGTGVV